jgi:hypothetical protein
MENEQLIKDLSLALMHLTGWEEETITKETICRAWKGYDFDALDSLRDDGLIDYSNKAKSLYLMQKGEDKAKEIVEKLKDVF